MNDTPTNDDMPSRTRPRRMDGPSAIRYLLTASTIYQRTVKDTVEVIRTAIDEGMPAGSELEYAQLMLALAETERALGWVAERCRVLLGEEETT